MKRVIFCGLVPLALSSCGYNRIQTLDEQVDNFRSQIEVQLQRRADLVPNLVATVKGFAEQEQEIFDAVTQARAQLGGAVDGGNLAEMAAANRTLGSALGRLIAIAEDNPEIRSEPCRISWKEPKTGFPLPVRTTTRLSRNTIRTSAGFRKSLPPR
jgi:LemA protein